MKKKQKKKYVWNASWRETILFTKQIYTKRLYAFSYDQWRVIKEWLIIRPQKNRK